MADAPYDFGAAVAEIAKLTCDVQVYADIASGTPSQTGQQILVERRAVLLERLAVAQRDFNERLQGLAPGARRETGGG